MMFKIDVRESADKVRDYIEENNVLVPALLDSNGSVTISYGIFGTPSTFFIDMSGIIQEVKYGPFRSAGEIESYLGSIMP
jgi:peroxiredoxin